MTATLTREVAVPAAEIADTRFTETDLPKPPDSRHPAWALRLPPERDAAMAALQPERTAQADAFCAWLTATRTQAATRAVRGHQFCTTNARATTEDVALYRRLLAWVSWCDCALWLLTQWYAAPNAQPRPESLVLPFHGFVGTDGRPFRLVRELSGLGDEMLLEEVLTVWRADALASGDLTDVGMPTEPTEPQLAA